MKGYIQIYGKQIRNYDFNVGVFSSITKNGNITEIKVYENETIKGSVKVIHFKPALPEEYTNGLYINFIERHVESINIYLDSIGCEEKVEITEFMGCIIHQLLSTSINIS